MLLKETFLLREQEISFYLRNTPTFLSKIQSFKLTTISYYDIFWEIGECHVKKPKS